MSISIEEANTLLKSDVSKAYCNIGDMFDNVVVLKGSTASPTVQAIVEIKPDKMEKVFERYVKSGKGLKIFAKFMPYRINGKDVDNRPRIEPAIYKYLYEKLTVTGATPHILNFIASAYCKHVKNNLNWMNKEERKIAFEHWNRNWKTSETSVKGFVDALQDGKVMFIEYANGKQLKEMMLDGSFDPLELKNVIFQVGYTLYQMALVGVRHNDIHIGNVFIEELPLPRSTVYYITEDKTVIIKSKYVARIFDFDVSAFTIKVPKSLHNMRVDKLMCKNTGVCSNPMPMFDWFTFNWYLMRYGRSNQVKSDELIMEIYNHINKIIIDPQIFADESMRFNGRYCEFVDDTKKACKKNAVFPKGKLMSFMDLVDDQYFGSTSPSVMDLISAGHGKTYQSVKL